jgi:hypothetical protein
MEGIAYTPGLGVPYQLPLSRFLPPLKKGVVGKWLSERAPKGSWLIDPYGANPALAYEAALAGYRILVACNNPILELILEMITLSTPKETFNSVVADLAVTKKGDERLEGYIQALYDTPCPKCNKLVPATAFVWKKGSSQPISRRVNCANCGGEGEYDITSFDLEKLQQIDKSNLQRAWAISRLGTLNENQHHIVDDALSVYGSRALYVLFTLINRTETLNIPPEKRRLLDLLLIQLCDEGNSLWQSTGGLSRPRILSIPGQFIEHNLWMRLETLMSQWQFIDSPIPMTRYPALPPETGGICLHSGRLKNILPLTGEIQPTAVVTVVPRTNQAFWTLSGLWAGWLWGREAVQPLLAAFERLRYDWHWHAQALKSTLFIIPYLGEKIPILLLAPELTQSFLMALGIGSQAAGLTIIGMSARLDEADAQILCSPSFSFTNLMIGEIKPIIRSEIKEHLRSKGEPASFFELFTVGLLAIARKGRLFKDPDSIPLDLHNTIEGTLMDILAETASFQLFGRGTFDSPRMWWLTKDEETDPPQSELVEEFIIQTLQSRNEIAFADLDGLVCNEFNNLLTPSFLYTHLCAGSYSDESLFQQGHYIFRTQDEPGKRKIDLLKARERIVKIGQRLGCEVIEGDPVVWLENGMIRYRFFFLTSVKIYPILTMQHTTDQGQNVIVLPGGRANVLSFRLKHDPRLLLLAKDWHFLKFRHLKDISEQTDLTSKGWDDILDNDPPHWENAQQIAMF